jgi:thymidylate kinase
MRKTIILEGIDCVGKSTIKELLNKTTNYKHCVIDRLYGSCFAYSLLHRRGNSIEFLETERQLDSKSFYLVYLYCDKKTIMKRQSSKDDNDIKEDDVDKLLKYYHLYLANTRLKTLKLNTDKLSPKQVVEKIIKWIK